MSTTILSDPMMITAPETQPPSSKLIVQTEIEFAKCHCCSLTEECTRAYIERIKDRYNGNWICGLCSEAVKDEIVRTERLISSEEALNKHMSFCKTFNSSEPAVVDPTVHLISAMKQILRRSLESPRAMKSMPSSPMKKDEEINRAGLTRSGSCFSSLTR